MRRGALVAVLVVVSSVLTSCTDDGAATRATAATTAAPSGPLVPQAPASKVCQVLGETDRERGEPTINRTEMNAGIAGSDLGIPIEHQGQLHLYFGDTFPIASLVPETGVLGDSLAVTTDTVPDDCLSLDFALRRPSVFAAATIPGVDLGALDVPTGGFSDGTAVYAFYSTDQMTRSVLARSPTGGPDFSLVYPVASDRFVNVATQVFENAEFPGLPSDSGEGVVLIGSGAYRKSSPSLAWMPLDQVTDPTSWRYFAGLDRDGRPTWSASAADAHDLFDQPCFGEVSATWVPTVSRWVLLYNCDDPRGIVLRSASVPWAWSDSAAIFDTDADGGACHFIHGVADPPCDALSDPGRTDQRGGTYGPYLLGRFTRTTSDQTELFFLMSTWNPYTVVLMRVVVQVAPS